MLREIDNKMLDACLKSDLALAQKLLGQNANPAALDENGFSILDHAMSSKNDNQVDMVYILTKSRKPDYEALHLNSGAMRFFEEQKSQYANEFSELFQTAANKALLDYSSQKTQEQKDVNNALAHAEYALANGANINTQDNAEAITPLMNAAKQGNSAMVHFLISQGADVDMADKNGFTALMHAASSGHSQAVQLLLDKQASTTKRCQEKGFSAADYAYVNEKVDAYGILVTHDAQSIIAQGKRDEVFNFFLNQHSHTNSDKEQRAAANRWLGEIYASRMFIQRDDDISKQLDASALKYIKMAVKLKDPMAHTMMGNAYERGLYGLDRSPEAEFNKSKAFQYYKKAADHYQEPWAMSRLANIYQKGDSALGISKDESKAIDYKDKADALTFGRVSALRRQSHIPLVSGQVANIDSSQEELASQGSLFQDKLKEQKAPTTQVAVSR